MCSMFVCIVSNSVYQNNIYPRLWFKMEEIYYKTLLRITLIHKDFLLKIKPRVEYNWRDINLYSFNRFAP